MLKTSTDRNASSFPSLDDRVGHLLRRAYQKASGNLARRLRDTGLSVPRYAVLHRLREIGPVSQNRLGRLVAMEPGNIHDIVHALRTDNLVATRPDPGDNRRRLVELTNNGIVLIDKLVKASDEATQETLASLNPGEQAMLKSLLSRIIDDIDA